MEEKKIRPQDRWNEKVGLTSKSYKLKKDLVKQFADACENAGMSQAGQLTVMMRDFSTKKEVEREYIDKKEPIIQVLLNAGNAVSVLRKMQGAIADEQIQDEVGEIIDILYSINQDALKALNKFYDVYNKIYQQTT